MNDSICYLTVFHFSAYNDLNLETAQVKRLSFEDYEKSEKHISSFLVCEWPLRKKQAKKEKKKKWKKNKKSLNVAKCNCKDKRLREGKGVTNLSTGIRQYGAVIITFQDLTRALYCFSLGVTKRVLYALHGKIFSGAIDA